jgi:hypothetical protein
MPNDFPEPGAPNTAIESGRGFEGLSEYSLISERIVRRLSSSRGSTVNSAPNLPSGMPRRTSSAPRRTISAATSSRRSSNSSCRMDQDVPAGSPTLADDASGGVTGSALVVERPGTGTVMKVSVSAAIFAASVSVGAARLARGADAPRTPYPSWCRVRIAANPLRIPGLRSSSPGCRSIWRTMPPSRQVV